MAIKTTTQRGFKHHCPLCGEEDTIRVHLAEVHTLTCSSCDNEITADDLREIIAQWQALLAWLDTAPECKD